MGLKEIAAEWPNVFGTYQYGPVRIVFPDQPGIVDLPAGSFKLVWMSPPLDMSGTTPTLPDWLPDPTSDAWKRDTDAGKDQKPDPQREARDEAVGRAIKHSP